MTFRPNYRLLAPLLAFGVAVFLLHPLAAAAKDLSLAPAGVRNFVEANCYDCHDGAGAEAGFDFAALGFDLSKPAAVRRWTQVFDRVHLGQMPPEDAEQPTAKSHETFLKEAGDWLRSYQHEQNQSLGRVRSRRLTRREVERSLHDLLGIDIPLQHLMTEDARTAGFTTVASGQAMSHFQLQQHLQAVDAALDEAFTRAMTPDDTFTRSFDAEGVARRNPRRRCREPEMLNDHAVVWSGGVIFYGRLPATTARADGWYHFKLKVKGLKLPASGGVWTTISTGQCTSGAPLLNLVKVFEATEQHRTIEFTAWLPKGHMLEVRPGDITLKRARFAGGQIGAGEGGPQNVPGIAIHSLEMQRVHREDDQAVRRHLFGSLSVKTGSGRWRGKVESNQPAADARKLMVAFASRAFRHPVSESDIENYIAIVSQELKDGKPLLDAVRLGYRALLCSPRFLYITEKPGKLDACAIATRLSYFLTGSMPDVQLRQLAETGELNDRRVIRAEAERLLNEAREDRRFVADFAAEWLDLELIDFTQPDRKLYREFDAVVQKSMLDETLRFLETALAKNHGPASMVSADFTFLNSRLARYYDIPGITGDELRRVELSGEQRPGGLLSQGALLKVTANGSNTSPVVRGVWISERIMGVHIPPPPDNVPAIEPDIRGAKTIREQLAKHRSQQSCAVCHVNIDPPGFALENFDAAGQWRDRYLLLSGGRRKGGPKVDPSYQMADGQAFDSYREFRQVIAGKPRKLAVNLVEKLVTYGTGAPVSFADRDDIERIVDASKDDNDSYGFRTLLLNVVASDTFLCK